MSDKTATKGPPIDAPKKFSATGAYNRTAMTVKLSWDYPKSATDDKSANRWSGTIVHIALDTNTAPNTVKKKKVVVGVEGYTTWKNKKGKKTNTLYKADKKTGKATSKYKGDTDKNKVKTVSSGVTSVVVINEQCKKGTSKKSKSYTIDLTKYNPLTTKNLDAVICKLQGYNKFSLGASKTKTFNENIPWALYQVALANPDKPLIEQNYINSSRTINFQCTATQPGGGKHWYCTDYDFIVTRYVLNTKTKVNETTYKVNEVNKQRGDLIFNKAYSLEPNDLVSMNSKVEVYFNVMAKGAHGNSAENSENGTWTFAYPHQMEIPLRPGGNGATQIAISGDLVTIPFTKYNSKVDNTNRYTSTVWLERLPDFMVPERLLLTATDDVWLAQAARATSWEKVGGEFDPNVGSFVRNSNLDRAGLSSPYSRTFYRIGAKNLSFDQDEFYIYSTPAVYPIYSKIPKPSNDAIDFLECVPEKNGTSVRVVLAYQVHYEGEYPTSDGCEVSWSDDYNSWLSNNPPSKFDMPDMDNLGAEYFRVKIPQVTNPISEDTYKYWLIPDSWDAEKKTAKYTELTGTGANQRGFMFTSKAYIMGLTEGTKYYFRARRYLEESTDLPRLYGPYANYSSNLGYEDASSATKVITPTTIPENVKLKVTSPVPVGKDLELVWTFEGDGTQTEWVLKRYTASEITETDPPAGSTGKAWKLLETAVGVEVKTSKDASGYTLLPYNTTYDSDGAVKEVGVSEYLEDNMVYFVVGAKTTGDFGYSAPVQVRFVEPPSASLGVPSTITVQPMKISIGSNIESCSATIKVSAVDSVTRQGPTGLKNQPSGYIVYSKKFSASDLHWTSYSGPVVPTSQVVGSQENESGWSDIPQAYDERYPDYYRCYEYTVSGVTHWTTPEIDRPLSELKLLGTTASNPVLLWYAGVENEIPSVPMPVDVEQEGYSSMNPSAQGWCEKNGVEGNRYYEVTSDTEVSNSHVYYEMCGASSTSTAHSTWTSVLPVYDSGHPVYYYCYGFQIADYEGHQRYAWTEVSVDQGMSELRAIGLPSQSVTPLWNVESAPGYFSNVMLPPALELLDGARYEVSLVLEDPETKLDSKKPDVNGYDSPMLAQFAVSYSRVASPPTGNHVLIYSNQQTSTTDIQILTPPLHVPGDVYDIYRVTPDNIVRIGSDISPGQVLQDVYAPYSSSRASFSNPEEKAVNLRYRVALRTPDGTEAWRDFLYTLKNPSIRFDWGGVNAPLMEYTSLTIPYNLSYSDVFKKYFEARHHMNDRLPVGFWTTSVDRTSSISTEIIKYDNPRDKEALKSLAGYSGPVFVRRPDGCAYLANVEVNSYAVSYNSEVVPVSFEITEIELTPEYMLSSGSYLSSEDRDALDALLVAPAGFYDTLLVELKAQ